MRGFPIPIAVLLVAGCDRMGLEPYYADTGGASGIVLDIEPEGTVTFDPRSPESPPAHQDVTLRSVGTEDVPVIDIYLDDLTSRAFSIGDDLPLPRKIPPGNEYPVTVSFQPYAVAEFTGTLVIEVDNHGTLEQYTRDLVGKGCPADAQGCE